MSATRPAVETTSPKAALLSINTASSSPSRSGVSPTTADASPYIKAMIAHHRTDDSTLLESMYTLGAKLGQGSFGTVRLVQHKDTNTTYACKIMRKRRGDPSAYEQVQREVAIMKRVRHPHIIQLCEVFETPKQFFLIMEYCKGGELVQRVKSRRHCSEADVRIIILRLVNAIAYLHDQGIVHRDIKPENILVSADPMAAAAAEGGLPDLFNIKVSDFGLATFTNACNMMENIVGTPLYMAPEIVQNLGYSAQCDLWSIGVMMYLLLCGYRPEVERGLSQMIQEGQIEFPSAFWHDISAGGDLEIW
ncbi:Serine/threonine-protein kinase 33 [Geranomyces variabilis]|nr:Serine/threonine-protein kinase 33 [Geranomyces variabilis]